MEPLPHDRPFPATDLDVPATLVAFLEFLQLTACNKLAGLDERHVRLQLLPTSPTMTLLGVVKHLTAVLRQHALIHIGGADRPSLFSAGDPSFEFRLDPDDTVATVVAAFDDEWQQARAVLDTTDLATPITAYGRPTTAGRLLVDVVQETARHVGHMDLLRELIDGSTGE